MTGAQLGGLARTFIAFAAGFVPATLMSHDDFTTITGAAVALGVGVWSWYSKKSVTPTK